jgi:hypothetical protein
MNAVNRVIWNGWQASWLVVALVLATTIGCGKGKESGTVTINGTVVLDGSPLDGASVAFIGRGGAKLASAHTDRSGKFTLNAAVGSNQVTVAKGEPGPPPAQLTEEDMLMPTEEVLKSLPPPAKPLVPARYADPKTSGIVIEVVEGMESVELSLTSS